MAEYPTELAAVEALLDEDHDAAAQLITKLETGDLRRLGHAAQDLVTLCQDTWTRRILWRAE